MLSERYDSSDPKEAAYLMNVNLTEIILQLASLFALVRLESAFRDTDSLSRSRRGRSDDGRGWGAGVWGVGGGGDLISKRR